MLNKHFCRKWQMGHCQPQRKSLKWAPRTTFWYQLYDLLDSWPCTQTYALTFMWKQGHSQQQQFILGLPLSCLKLDLALSHIVMGCGWSRVNWNNIQPWLNIGRTENMNERIFCNNASTGIREAPFNLSPPLFGHCPFGGGSKPLPGWFGALF